MPWRRKKKIFFPKLRFPLTNSTIREAQVSVVSFQRDSCSVNGDSLPRISSYHSFEFSEEGMKVWWYYGIGVGIYHPYSTNWSFTSGLTVIKPFKSCQEKPEIVIQTKLRADRQLCSLFFCGDGGCTETFATFKELEDHVLQGLYTVPKSTSSFDKVKQSFASRMLSSTASHSFITSSPLPTSSLNETSNLDQFLKKGWALPIRSNFRYNQKQKLFLFKAFALGEETGKKTSPEDMQMRNSFQSNEYCTVKQIRSLYFQDGAIN